MIDVGGIEQLQIHPLHAGFGEWAQAVDDLGRRADQGSVGAKLVDFTADRIRPPRRPDPLAAVSIRAMILAVPPISSSLSIVSSWPRAQTL